MAIQPVQFNRTLNLHRFSTNVVSIKLYLTVSLRNWPNIWQLNMTGQVILARQVSNDATEHGPGEITSLLTFTGQSSGRSETSDCVHIYLIYICIHISNLKMSFRITWK